MLRLLKKNMKIIIFLLLVFIGCIFPMMNQSYATRAPKFGPDFVDELTKGGWVIDPSKKWVESEHLVSQNVVALFYPSSSPDWGWNTIYKVIRDITLWVMIAFFVWAWASLLFNRKPEDVKKTLRSLVYILIWGLFVYWANWIFGDVLNFNEGDFTASTNWWMRGVNDATHKIFFVVLSALKGFAFFLSIIMLVITWFRVMAAWEWDKWKKLVKWLINVVIWLMIIKWIDFIYYIAADTPNAVKNIAELIINIAKVFAYIYWVIIVIMVIVAWYLYMTDGWGWSNFKKATNVLVNILLSALVLFAFLLIIYQIFAEFQKGWDAVSEEAFIMAVRNIA